MEKKIIVAIILVIIIILGLGALSLFFKKDMTITYNNSEEEENRVINDKQVIKIYSKDELLNVKQCIDIFLTQLSIEQYDAEDSKIYNMLDKEYIEYNNINKTNVKSILENYYTDFEFEIDSIYKLDITDSVSLYFTYGALINTSKIEKSDYAFMVKMDKVNSTFSVYLNDYIEKNGYKESNIIDKKFDNIESMSTIDNNGNNVYNNKEYTDKDYISYYFGIYDLYLNYDNEKLYNILEAEYREKRFGSLENMKSYIEKYKDSLIGQMILSYDVKQYDGYTQYVCVDTNGNYYIFKETSVMQYTLLLDTYTIEIPEFKEKYDSANDMKKGAYNIEKIVQAINNHDYKYVYEKLDENFKKQYFPTREAFDQTMEFMFFERNSVTYDDYEKKSDIHIYTVTFKDYYGEIEFEDRKNIFMKLKDNYDFVFSFSLDNV